MSRIGKQSITVPEGVQIALDGKAVKVKGKKGELSFALPELVAVAHEGNLISVTRLDDSSQARALHGLSRALIQNMVTGVSQGFEKKLEIIGVGYRAQTSGRKLTMSLGFSHPIEMQAPEGVELEMDKEAKGKNILIVRGFDRQKVGQFAANVRSHRPPEPYKGKGIRYVGEHVVRKAGKTAGKE